ncbi:flagellar hook-length control protein FliK|uniref:Flagellar hook-length control protein FliK n=1 Tax=Brenneria salicis ATCC 15712 = DSM 30166 TaxID=714314 RepID=A0A366I5N6_9GAMM|nr:flagellar hook-length control protein FliK [Brenneria salicis]NMN91173.1 flagellar hook-length control protein FliK [Brenneria salicis ATCC 15712 = DSM 30166]RBP62299.1 flagellar hook-length control protein FliK [Brenneria salicis ATCC 15712 = DSM 30166]RLM30543.1 hypothetical protein BHG07_10155 [Brenneria salicis ATCC 15712 = DSM 30166]
MKLSALPITTSTGDASSSVDSLLNQGTLPKDFVELLSKHLSLSSDSSGDPAIVGAEADKEALLNTLRKDISALDGDDLNAVLASFRSLSGALTPSGEQAAENTLPSDKVEKSAAKEDEENSVTEATTAMQALFAMLPTISGTSTVVDGAISGKGLNLSELAGSKRQDLTTALAGADDAAGDIEDALSQLSGASASTSSAKVTGEKHAAQQSVTGETADDLAKFSAITAQISNDSGNQESAPTASNNLQTPQVSLASNVQPTLSSAPATPQTPVNTQLNAPFGSPQWQDALGQQIMMFSRNGQQSAELRLNPQELGSIQISLKIDDNQAQIHLVSANSQVRSALEAALPHLRNAMAESGINLGQSSVGSDASGWQQTQQQTASHGDTSGNNASYRQQFGNTSENVGDALEVPAHLQSMATSVNGVDIFA